MEEGLGKKIFYWKMTSSSVSQQGQTGNFLLMILEQEV